MFLSNKNGENRYPNSSEIIKSGPRPPDKTHGKKNAFQNRKSKTSLFSCRLRAGARANKSSPRCKKCVFGGPPLRPIKNLWYCKKMHRQGKPVPCSCSCNPGDHARSTSGAGGFGPCLSRRGLRWQSLPILRQQGGCQSRVHGRATPNWFDQLLAVLPRCTARQGH